MSRCLLALTQSVNGAYRSYCQAILAHHVLRSCTDYLPEWPACPPKSTTTLPEQRLYGAAGEDALLAMSHLLRSTRRCAVVWQRLSSTEVPIERKAPHFEEPGREAPWPPSRTPSLSAPQQGRRHDTKGCMVPYDVVGLQLAQLLGTRAFDFVASTTKCPGFLSPEPHKQQHLTAIVCL